MKHFGDIELIGGVIKNMVGENFSSDPTFSASEAGRIIYNTTSNEYKFNNGTEWVVFETDIVSSSVTLRATLGTNWVNPDFSFNPAPFNALDNISGLTGTESLFDVIFQLDNGITSALTVTKLQGVDIDFSGGLSAGDIIFFNGEDFIAGTLDNLVVQSITLDDLTDVTLTTLEDNEITIFQNSEWVNKAFFFQFEDLSNLSSVFVVNHNLNTQFCDVTIVDMSTATPSRIDPSLITSIEYDDANKLTVTLTGNKPVTIVVVGVALI